MTKSIILAPDDMTAGQYVTVFEVKNVHKQNNRQEDFIEMIGFNPSGSFGNETNNESSIEKDAYESLKGTVLKIDYIQLPYLVISFPFSDAYESPFLKRKKIVVPIDIRKVSFMKLDREYVNAFKKHQSNNDAKIIEETVEKLKKSLGKDIEQNHDKEKE
jgi:hypothetical protein